MPTRFTGLDVSTGFPFSQVNERGCTCQDLWQLNVSFYKKRTYFSRVTTHSRQKSLSSPLPPLCSAAVPTWFWDTQWSGSTPFRFSFLCPNHWALKSTIHFKLIFVVDLHFSLRFVFYLTCPCQVTLPSPVEKGTPTPITPPPSHLSRFINVDELLSALSHWLYCFPVDASLANWKTVALCSIVLPWDCFNYSNIRRFLYKLYNKFI